ncbi:hypothetical protein [Pseudomonas sp. AU10]|uniref:hypothetical protein n=1 Tax=Pseudomonas sp. AU10 TaxID=882697 RepID=UPI00398C8007
MQGASTLGRKQIKLCRWSIPTFEFVSNCEEGIYILIEGQLTVQDCNATLCLMPGELMFARRGNYVVSTGEHDCRLLWIPLSVGFLQNFIQRFGALLSEVERWEEGGLKDQVQHLM